MSRDPRQTFTSMRLAAMLGGLLFLSLGGASRVLAQGASGVLEEHDGTLEVLHEDRDNGSRFLFFLNKAKERLELRFSGEYPALQSGDQVRVRGRRIGANVLALDSTGNVQALAPANPNTFGGQKTLVILVKFNESDPASDKPYTLSTAQSVFNTTSNFDLENSFSQTWLTGVTNSGAAADIVGWFKINQSSTVCDYSTTASLADQAAMGAGVTLSQYTRKVYAFPQNACSWWGLGSVGGNPSRAWINGSLQLRVVAHEMGHNLGLYHSHALDCGAAVVGGTCSSSDYGDYFDTMGSSSYHYNAYQKERLGWLNYNASPPLTTVQSDGIYWISPYQTDTDDPKALKILKGLDSSGRKINYYLEYRRAIGFDAGLANNSNVMNGVLIRLGTELSGNTSYLLDMTPETSSWSDPALTVGKSFSDPDAGVTFTVLSADLTGATVSVTFSSGGSAVCSNSNPVVSLSPSSQSIGLGGSTSYTVTLTNTDSSACTSSTFILTSALPSGLSGSFSSSALNLAPGSSASASLLVSSSSSTGGGSYNFSVTGTNGGATTYKNTSSGLAKVISSLSVVAATDKSSYARNQVVKFSASVAADGTPVANANVNFKITKANGSVVSANATTGADGKAVYQLRLNKKDPSGTYQGQATASMGSISGTGSTNFTVQ
jgi:hypothetical protein